VAFLEKVKSVYQECILSVIHDSSLLVREGAQDRGVPSVLQESHQPPPLQCEGGGVAERVAVHPVSNSHPLVHHHGHQGSAGVAPLLAGVVGCPQGRHATRGYPKHRLQALGRSEPQVEVCGAVRQLAGQITQTHLLLQ